MNRKEASEVQVYLFPTALAWQEFPPEVRKQISQLLSILCIEIVEELAIPEQEISNESRSHSSMAP